MMARSRIEPGWLLVSVCPSGVSEDTGLGFGEHAHAGQRAQQAAQIRRVRAGTLGEGLHRRRAGHELIGDAQGRVN
jgi:hypothetical protein